MQGQIIYFKQDKAVLSVPTFVHSVPIKDEIFLNVNLKEPNRHESPKIENHVLPNEKPIFCIQDKSKNSYKLLNEHAKTPQKATILSAAFNLYSSETFTLKPNQRIAANTAISMAIPFGYYGRITPRSGLTLRKSIDIGAGVIDADYHGEI